MTRGDVKYQMSKLEKNKIILVSAARAGRGLVVGQISN